LSLSRAGLLCHHDDVGDGRYRVSLAKHGCLWLALTFHAAAELGIVSLE
jgi:hypothetical protein